MCKEDQVVLATFSLLMATKKKKQFCTLKVGIKAGLQLWLQGRTPGCAAEIRSQVLCVHWRQTGNQVWYWAWSNKYLAPR